MTAGPRLQILSIFAGYGVAGLFWGAFAASAPALQAIAGLGPGAFGLMLGSMTLAALPVMQLLGRVIRRIEGWAIPLCMASFALGNLALGLADGLAGLVVALVLLGASSGALDIALNMRTARIEEDTGARLFNRTHALFPFAMLLAAAGTGALREAGVPIAAIFPALALAGAALLERKAGGARPAPDPVSDPVSDEPAARGPLAGPVAILAAIAALAAFQEMAPQSWAAIFVETVRGAGPALAGLAPAAFTLGLSLGRLTAHAVEHRIAPMPTVRLAACLAVPAFLAVALLDTPGALLLAYLVAGIGVGPVEPAVFRSVARRAGEGARGPALATVTGIAYLGYLLSPPVLGQVAALLGWAALWGAAGLAAAAVAVLTLALPRATPRKPFGESSPNR